MKSITALSWSNAASIAIVAVAVYLTKNSWLLIGLIVPLINTIAVGLLELSRCGQSFIDEDVIKETLSKKKGK